MYQYNTLQPAPDLSGLGFSLKPPAWLRSAAGAVLKQTTVTIPTPMGPMTYDLSNPAQAKALQDIATKTKVSVGKQSGGGFMQQVETSVESIPGGWLTIAAVGAAAVLLFMFARRR